MRNEQVFVVTVGTPAGDDISVHGVYTTWEKAREVKDIIEGLYSGCQAWIDDFLLNED